MATMAWLNSCTPPPFRVAFTPFGPASSFSTPEETWSFIPCLVSALWTKAETSSSSTGRIRSSISTIVTSAPMSE